MFAVIKTGGKQYRVAAADVITVASLAGEPGDAVAFDTVLVLGQDGTTEVGAPTVPGATVAGEVVEQTRGPKVIAFKKRRRQNSKRKRGHRQDLTVIRITDILTGDAKPASKVAEDATDATAGQTALAETGHAESTAVAADSALGAGVKDAE
jgi:large subunit ribosomal protein L21